MSTIVLEGFGGPSFFSDGYGPLYGSAVPIFPPLPPPPTPLPNPTTLATNFNTADRVIRNAMRNAQLLEKGGDPSPEDYAEYLPRLNDLVNFMQTQGLKLWLNSLVNVALSVGQARYNFGPQRALRILEAYYVQPTYTAPGGYTYATSTPLNQLSWQEYNTLSASTQLGIPNSYLSDKKQQGTEIVLWPVPSNQVGPFGTGVPAINGLNSGYVTKGFLQCLVQSAPDNMVRITDRVMFPQEWYLALQWGLADELSSGQSESTIQRCQQRAAAYRMALEDWDVEDASITMSVNTQGMRSGRFGR